jgi:AcrR family transcriptional regulator
MVVARRPAKRAENRQSAYLARNRTALLHSGQMILAKFGPSATIEEILSIAQVSPTTIYKYFDSRENFLVMAQLSLWQEWEKWALAASQEINDPLERFINPIRLLIRVSATHPDLAQSLGNPTTSPEFLIQYLSKDSAKIAKALAKAGVVSSETQEARFLLFSHAVIAIIKTAITDTAPKSAECEKMLVIAMGMLGISEVKAQKAISKKIVIPVITLK